MIKNEWKALNKKKFLFVVMLALMLVPALYNFIFLPSMWDPYGQLSKLPVAVVNEDKGAQLNGKSMALGSDLTKELAKTKTLDYQFVDKTTAEKGLADGKYYMVITLPENLSSNAASLLDTTPKKVNIDYQTSKGRNFISSKMSESAMQKLQLSVSQSITQTYTQAIFTNLSKLKSGVSQAATGSQQIADGTQAAQSGSSSLSSNLDSLSNSTLDFVDGSSKLEVGLSQYVDAVSKVADGADQLKSGTAAFASGAAQLSQGLDTLSQQTQLPDSQKAELAQLEAGLTQLNQAIQTGSDSSAITDSATAMAAGMQALQQSQVSQVAAVQSTTAFQSLDSAQQTEILQALEPTATTAALQQMAQGLQSLQTALGGLSTQQQTLQAAAGQVLPPATATLSKLADGLSSVSAALTNQLQPGANLLAQNSISLQNGANQLAQGTTQLRPIGPQLDTGASQLVSGSQAFMTGAEQLAAGGQRLTGSLGTLATGADTLSSRLAAANKDLASTSTGQEQATAVANPTNLTQTDTSTSANNGTGMTPYMISVGLFVGAIAVNVIVGRGFSDEKKAKSSWDLLLGKLAVNGLLAVAQGILVTGVVFLLGLKATHPWGLLFGNVLIAFSFMMLVTFLNLWLGKVGAFLSLVLLILQLATSAGTYPIQLSFPIFQAINPWLPMTYSVLYLRQVISLSGSVTTYVWILLAIALFFMALIPLTSRKNIFQKLQAL